MSRQRRRPFFQPRLANDERMAGQAFQVDEAGIGHLADDLDLHRPGQGFHRRVVVEVVVFLGETAQNGYEQEQVASLFSDKPGRYR